MIINAAEMKMAFGEEGKAERKVSERTAELVAVENHLAAKKAQTMIEQGKALGSNDKERDASMRLLLVEEFNAVANQEILLAQAKGIYAEKHAAARYYRTLAMFATSTLGAVEVE